MRLSPEELVDWFYTANPALAADKARYIAMLRSPPPGTKRSEVVSGVKQGVNDTLTKAKWLPADEKAQIDVALAGKGLPSLRKMEATLKKKHQRILARGHIRNDEEFYIVAEILGDMEFEISDPDRARLGEMSFTYEARSK